jgi:hypothetical protein
MDKHGLTSFATGLIRDASSFSHNVLAHVSCIPACLYQPAEESQRGAHSRKPEPNSCSQPSIITPTQTSKPNASSKLVPFTQALCDLWRENDVPPRRRFSMAGVRSVARLILETNPRTPILCNCSTSMPTSQRLSVKHNGLGTNCDDFFGCFNAIVPRHGNIQDC